MYDSCGFLNKKKKKKKKKKKDSCMERESTRIFKVAFSKIVKALCYLLSMSLKKGIF